MERTTNMQTANVNPPITVTGRHMELTDALRDYSVKKIEGLHLDYPRIIEAKVILDVQDHRQIAEIILFCANHITIEASSESGDMYAAIDETISKIARRMRKHKTRLLRKNRPRNGSIRHISEQVFDAAILDNEPVSAADEHEEIFPSGVHKEHYQLKPLYNNEAIMELELGEKSFILFENAVNGRLAVIYRRRDGHYGLIEPDDVSVVHPE